MFLKLKSLYYFVRADHLRFLVVCSSLIFLLIGTLYVAIYNPTGDEPHYLIISEALVKYHSFGSLQQMYLARGPEVYFDAVKYHHIIKNWSGWWIPGHSPGGPVL